MGDIETTVPIARLIDGNDGKCVFEDGAVVLNTGDPDDPPLAKSLVSPAKSISFLWASGDSDSVSLQMSPGSVIIPLEGELDVTVSSRDNRRFSVGDVLEFHGTSNKDLFCRPVNGTPFRFAVIDLNDGTVSTNADPMDLSIHAGGVDYLRTFDDSDGKSDTVAGSLPYCYRQPNGCLSTEMILIFGFQFVLAPPDLNYSWHRAPQRQFVIPMTGGMEVENGRGVRHTVLPGEIYVGEDVNGQGHITRSIDGCERLSIFAHLSGRLT